VKGVRAANSGSKLLAATLISLAPFAVGLAASASYFGRAYPNWLYWWLCISYGFLFCGELQAWWIPYLFFSQPERAARYQVMFGATHAFLPERNGIRLKYAARDPSRCDGLLIDCSRRVNRTEELAVSAIQLFSPKGPPHKLSVFIINEILMTTTACFQWNSGEPMYTTRDAPTHLSHREKIIRL